ncbi:MAG: hypothetical protein ACOX3U_05880 [Christensenellales bacterium]
MTEDRLKWFRLDNSAKLYPVLVTRYTQSLFRVSVFLREEVDPETLNRALVEIMPRFPSFNVRLRRGLFWYFFEENTSSPRVFLDDGIVLKKINPRTNRHFLLTVLYYNSRISIEFFHAITDGLGGSEFIKALVFQYYRLKGYNLDPGDSVIHIGKPFDEREIEDSFIVNHSKKTWKDVIKKTAKTIQGDNAYRIKGGYYELPGYGIIEGIVDADKLLETARSKSLTVTSYLGAAFLYAVYKLTDKKKFRPLTLFIPINLRGIFKSRTLRNFVLFSRAGIREDKENLSFDDFARAIEKDIKEDIKYENIKDKMDSMVYLEKMWLMRVIPLPLKYLFFKIGKFLMWKNSHTAILSNMGKIKIPESLEPFVEGIALNVNVSRNAPVSIAVASCNNSTRIMVTTMLKERDIIREFFRILTRDGLELKVRSNLREDKRYVL